MGRCRDCRWWILNYRGEHAECSHIPVATIDEYPLPGIFVRTGGGRDVVLMTPPDFGCTLFEAEEG